MPGGASSTLPDAVGGRRLTAMPIQFPINRRTALQRFGALAVLPLLGAAKRKPLPVAAIVTEYRNNSHADVIIGKILEGWKQDGGPGPDLTVAAMYTDQVPKGDMSRALARKHGFPITKTVEEAITLGTDRVQVAGVLSIGEHGDYPYTPDTKQHMYPRRRFFDAITATLRKAGKVVPVFNDKHLAYNWKDARHMVDTARRMKIPFMAGSSLPVAWRLPAATLPIGSEVEAAVGIGYGGIESYGFHALETLQSLTERRKGGETGVASVRLAKGEAIWQTQRDGFWTMELLQAALVAAQIKTSGAALKKQLTDGTVFYLIEYRDGLKAAVAMVNGIGNQFGAALKLRGTAKPFANWYWLQDGKPYGHFAHLLRAIEHMVHTGQPAYPVERTLLTTGILDRVMHSQMLGGKKLDSPELAIKYKPADWTFANRDGGFPLPK